MQSVRHPRALIEARDPDESESLPALQKTFSLLRAHAGNDFSCHKTGTISRRLERRMSVHPFDSLPRYVRFLQENPQQVGLLYKELLIGVTNFFRDPGLFAVLREKAIPRLFQHRPKDHTVRVWNPGCSSGSDYSRPDFDGSAALAVAAGKRV
jgi:two-component system, chemotaxis family, CheB/CheR fusion protein